MERVSEQMEEIRKVADMVYVREGSPSFVHQLKSLLLTVDEFLRKINVRSPVPHSRVPIHPYHIHPYTHTTYTHTCMPTYS